MKYKVKNIIMYMLLIYTMFLFVSFAANIYAQPNSTAEIEIISGNGPTFPVNPENPEENLPGGEGVPGSLEIVHITTFDFGKISITEKKGVYNTITTDKPNIQVVDLRGTHTGWSVSASMTHFQDQGKLTLPSAEIQILDGRPKSVTSNLYAPHQLPNIILTADNEPVKIISASDGTGMGLWVMRWYPDEGESYIKLIIPAGAAEKGMHKATINWILSDIP